MPRELSHFVYGQGHTVQHVRIARVTCTGGQRKRLANILPNHLNAIRERIGLLLITPCSLDCIVKKRH